VTLFEGAVILMLLLVLAGLVVIRVRSGDALPARPLPPPISGGAVGAELVDIYSRLDEIMGAVTGLHEDVLRRPAGAAPIAVAAPKPHRHQFMLTSEERNNKVLRKIYTCRVNDCPDTYIDEEPEPVLQREPD
jgi:hypothetical protein